MTKVDKLAQLAEKLPESNVEKLTLVAQGMAMAQGSSETDQRTA